MAESNPVTLSKSLNQFTFKLYEKLASGQKDNFFISPYSISAALSMCLIGARDGTAEEIKKLLGLSALSDTEIHKQTAEFEAVLKSLSGDVALNTANRIYPSIGFELKPEFSQTLKTHFNSGVQALDFVKSAESAKTINAWVAEQTKDNIKDLVPASLLDAMTRLILVNAIYFKGSWKNKFDSSLTYKEDFNLCDGSKVKVDMMKLTTKKFKLRTNPAGLKATMCEFPYVGDNVSMTIILPHEGIKIAEVEKQLTADTLTELLETYCEMGKVFAYIPKFKLEYKSELSGHLKSMGIPLAFDPAKANFSGISDFEDLSITKVIHQAVVEVSEEGTEAAAATAVAMNKRCAVMEFPPEDFKCDRPFIFVIHEKKTNAILFIGKYLKPR